MNHVSQSSASRIVQSGSFQALLASKKAFLLPSTVFFLVYYFMLPLLTSYSKILNEPAVGAISWAWVFAFSQFIMTWALCIIYSRKSAKFDTMVAGIRKEAEGGNG